MSIAYYISTAILLLSGLTPQYQRSVVSKNSSKYVAQQPTKPYKVLKIKRLKNLFLIYAQKSDSLFKIVSLNDTSAKCSNVKKGCFYAFKLHSHFEHKLLGVSFPASNRLLITHYNYYGTLVPVEDSSRRDLYIADNLTGLCLH